MLIADDVFALSPAIRYVAIYRQGILDSHQKTNLADVSAAESDKYEELFVNPTLLKLVQQRGNLDCGGARYLVVRYGNFYQLVVALLDGHISVCFDLSVNPLSHADQIERMALS